DEARHLRTRRLDVLAVDAVVADVRVGHRHDLPGGGGIGQHLLVAAERGIEDDLAGHLAAVTEAQPLEERPVLERERGSRARPPPPPPAPPPGAPARPA